MAVLRARIEQATYRCSKNELERLLLQLYLVHIFSLVFVSTLTQTSLCP
jgi:hypothetical protein